MKTTIKEGTAIKGEEIFHIDNSRIFKRIFKILSVTKNNRFRIEIEIETTNGNDYTKTISYIEKKTVSFSKMLEMQWDFLKYCTSSEIISLNYKHTK